MKDPQDGYSFVYPFGWQEVAVKGQDIVYKDVIEPLESVSVSITQTDKADVTEFGSPAEVHPKRPLSSITCRQSHADMPYPAALHGDWTVCMCCCLRHVAVRMLTAEATSAVQVALTLAEKVLSPPKQEVKVLNVDQVRAQITMCWVGQWGMPSQAVFLPAASRGPQSVWSP